MRGDAWSAFGQAHRMISCAEYGLHFAREGDHWRCVEYPDLLMLRDPERYRVGPSPSAHSMRRCGTWQRGGSTRHQ